MQNGELMKTYENSKIPRLFKLMEEKGIKASQLTRDLNISSGNISGWKTGVGLPSNAVLHALAQYLNTTVEYLKGETDVKQNSEPKNEQKKDPAQMSREEKLSYIMHKYFQMSDEERKSLEQFADYLLEKREKTSPGDSSDQ